jgi:hypothetical protein
MRVPGPLPGLLLLLPQALQDVRGISGYSPQTVFWSQVSDWAFFMFRLRDILVRIRILGSILST